MQKIFFYLTTISLLAIGFLVIAPLFVSANIYKKYLTETIESSTGLKAEVKGDAYISFLPIPEVVVKHLVISNVEGASNVTFMEADAVYIRSSLMKMLTGQVSADKLILVHPVVEVERFDNGKNNLDIITETLKSKKNEDLSLLRKLSVSNGSITFREGVAYNSLDYINGDFYSGSVNGPFEIEGNFLHMTNKIDFEFELGDITKNSELKFSLNAKDFKLNVTGDYNASDKSVQNGKVKGNIVNIGSFINNVISDSSIISRINSDEEVNVEGSFSFNNNNASFKDVNIDSKSIGGKINVDTFFDGASKSNLKWDIRLALSKIDFDTLITDKSVLAKSESGVIDYYASTFSETSIASYSFDMPTSLSLIFDLNIDEIKYNNDKIQNLNINADIAAGNAIINSFSAILPGNTKASFVGHVDNNGTRPLLEGKVEVIGTKMYDFLTWIYPETKFINKDNLNEYMINFDLEMTPRRIEFSNINSSVDKTLLTGNLSVRPEGRIPVINGNITIDRLNLDDYNISSKIDELADKFIDDRHDNSLESSWINLFNKRLELSLNAKDITFNNNNFKTLESSIVLSRGLFNIQRLVLNSDPVALVGNFNINLLGAKPQIGINVYSQRLDTSVWPESNHKFSDLTNGWNWSNNKIDFLGLGRFSGDVNINVNNLKNDNILIQDLILNGKIDNKIFKISTARGSFYDGKFNVQGSIGIGRVPSLGIAVETYDMSIWRLINIFKPEPGITGKMNFGGTFKTFGKTPYEWIKNMVFASRFAASDVVFSNYDLNMIMTESQKLFSVIDMKSVIEKAENSGSTEFYSISGTMKAEKGLLRMENTQIATQRSRGLFAGNISLINLQTNSLAKITFSPERNNKVNLIYNIKGPLYNLNTTLNTNELENYITNKGIR